MSFSHLLVIIVTHFPHEVVWTLLSYHGEKFRRRELNTGSFASMRSDYVFSFFFFFFLLKIVFQDNALILGGSTVMNLYPISLYKTITIVHSSIAVSSHLSCLRSDACCLNGNLFLALASGTAPSSFSSHNI